MIANLIHFSKNTGYDTGTIQQTGIMRKSKMAIEPGRLFLFMPVFSQSFFTLVGGHFMPFSLFTAWHVFKYFLIYVFKIVTSAFEAPILRHFFESGKLVPEMNLHGNLFF